VPAGGGGGGVIHRQLHHIHPKQNIGDGIAAGEEFGGGQLHPEHHRRCEDEQRVGVESANAGAQNHQHTDEAEYHGTNTAAR